MSGLVRLSLFLCFTVSLHVYLAALIVSGVNRPDRCMGAYTTRRT